MAGHNKILGGGGFHHVAIRVKDFAASVKFYTEVLGFTEKISWGEDQSRGILLDTGDGNYFELFAGASAEPKPEGAYLHIALRCDDPDAALARAMPQGRLRGDDGAHRAGHPQQAHPDARPHLLLQGPRW